MADSPGGIRSYLSAASESERECLEEYKDIIQAIDGLDLLFRQIVTGRIHGIHPAGAFLGTNSHAAFLAAVSTALRGQSPPTFMILRGCIESALYALLIGVEKGDADIWLKRHENIEAAKAKFNANRAIQKLDQIDPNLGFMAKDAYQWAIEFGGHPNPRSVLAHIRAKDEIDEGHPFSLIYIQASDSVAVLRCLSACVENGCMAVAILCHAHNNHPDMGKTFEAVWKLFHGFQAELAKAGYIERPDKG